MIDVQNCSKCQKWMKSADSCATCFRTKKIEDLMTIRKQSELITKMPKQDLLQLQNAQAQKQKAENNLVVDVKREELY